MVLPEAYVIQKFYQFAGSPKYNRLTKTYQGGCPVCREGKSWGRKKRLFYVAATRAKSTLVLTKSKKRMTNGLIKNNSCRISYSNIPCSMTRKIAYWFYSRYPILIPG